MKSKVNRINNLLLVYIACKKNSKNMKRIRDLLEKNVILN